MSFPKYPAYKPSGVGWLGEVPEHWGVAPLKHHASLKGRLGWQGLRADEYTDEGPFLVTSEHFENDRIAWDRCYHVTDERFSLAPDIQLRPDDLLMMKDGAAMGKLAFVDTLPGPACLNSHLLLFRPRLGAFINRFLYYLLSGPVFETYMLRERKGSTFFGISQESIGNFPFLMAPLAEQVAIVTFLDRETARIDALVVEQERLIDLLREKRQAVISHAVTKGLEPKVPMKDSGLEWLGKVPAHWPVGRIGYYATVENGSTPSKDNVAYWEGGTVPWVASGEVNQGRVREATQLITEAALAESSLRLLPAGAVLVGLVGQGKTRGMSAILEIPAAINQNLAAVVCGARLSPSYLHHALGTAYEYVREYGRGGQQAALNCEVLRAVRMPVPPRGEQDAIVKWINAAAKEHDTLLAEAQNAITLLRERRAALISAAVNGQIDVRGLA